MGAGAEGMDRFEQAGFPRAILANQDVDLRQRHFDRLERFVILDSKRIDHYRSLVTEPGDIDGPRCVSLDCTSLNNGRKVNRQRRVS